MSTCLSASSHLKLLELDLQLIQLHGQIGHSETERRGQRRRQISALQLCHQAELLRHDVQLFDLVMLEGRLLGGRWLGEGLDSGVLEHVLIDCRSPIGIVQFLCHVKPASCKEGFSGANQQ